MRTFKEWKILLSLKSPKCPIVIHSLKDFFSFSTISGGTSRLLSNYFLFIVNSGFENSDFYACPNKQTEPECRVSPKSMPNDIRFASFFSFVDHCHESAPTSLDSNKGFRKQQNPRKLVSFLPFADAPDIDG